MDVDKLFSLKQPCSQCPFLKEGGVQLCEGRIEEIVADINEDKPFFCHKTTEKKKNQLRSRTACIALDQ